MKRRALLSGIVPAVAGAAGACRSSVADVLKGGSPVSSAGIRNLEVMALIVNQWLATMMDNTRGLVPYIYERVCDSDDRLDGCVVVKKVIEIDTTENFKSKVWSFGRVGIGSECEVAIREAARAAIRDCVSACLKPITVLGRYGANEERFTAEFQREKFKTVYKVDASPESGCDVIEYWMATSSKQRLPMSTSLNLQHVSSWDNFETSRAVVELEVRSSIKRHAGEIFAYEMRYKGVKWTPCTIPVAFPQQS